MGNSDKEARGGETTRWRYTSQKGIGAARGSRVVQRLGSSQECSQGGTSVSLSLITQIVMKSKASIGAHPIHSIIIPFPIAFLTGSVVFDGLSRAVASEALYHTAGHCMIAGVCTGLLAAIPGIIDFTQVIPDDSRAKDKATYHLAVNTIALIAFLVSYLARPVYAERDVLTIVPAYIGLLFLSVGGWLGGALVYEEKVGIAEDKLREPDIVAPPWQRHEGETGAYPHH